MDIRLEQSTTQCVSTRLWRCYMKMKVIFDITKEEPTGSLLTKPTEKHFVLLVSPEYAWHKAYLQQTSSLCFLTKVFWVCHRRTKLRLSSHNIRTHAHHWWKEVFIYVYHISSINNHSAYRICSSRDSTLQVQLSQVQKI